MGSEKNKAGGHEEDGKSQTKNHRKSHKNKNKQMVAPTIALLIFGAATAIIGFKLGTEYADSNCAAQTSLSPAHNYLLNESQMHDIQYMTHPEDPGQLRYIDPDLANALGSAGLKIITVQGFRLTNPSQSATDTNLTLENQLNAIVDHLSRYSDPEGHISGGYDLSDGEIDISGQNKSASVSVQYVTCAT